MGSSLSLIFISLSRSDFTLTLMRNLKTPNGMHDSKAVETASVCSSEGICESLVPCNVPEPEAVPDVEERSKDDKLWSDFNEVIDADFPSPPLPLEDYIPIAFDNEFKSILYSTCEDYRTWMAEAVDFLQTAEQLKIKVCYSSCICYVYTRQGCISITLLPVADHSQMFGII